MQALVVAANVGLTGPGLYIYVCVCVCVYMTAQTRPVRLGKRSKSDFTGLRHLTPLPHSEWPKTSCLLHVFWCSCVT